jgi:two-component system LytT family response regulator
MIRAMIVDDEPLALEALRILLSREPDVEIVAEAENAAGAVEGILAHRPDLLLLDIQMPDADGFQVIARVASRHLPAVVFVSAHDQHAVRAFDVFALDYVLKPVDPERLRIAVERSRRALGTRYDAGRERLGALLDALEGNPLGESTALPGCISRFTVRARNRYRVVQARDVRWIESAGNYVTLHAADGQHLVRATLSGLERRLDPAVFARIHRRCIVNVGNVREIADRGHGRYDVVLEDGTRLGLGREYRRHVDGLRASMASPRSYRSPDGRDPRDRGNPS